jgi:hypothetical protein
MTYGVVIGTSSYGSQEIMGHRFVLNTGGCIHTTPNEGDCDGTFTIYHVVAPEGQRIYVVCLPGHGGYVNTPDLVARITLYAERYKLEVDGGETHEGDIANGKVNPEATHAVTLNRIIAYSRV